MSFPSLYDFLDYYFFAFAYDDFALGLQHVPPFLIISWVQVDPTYHYSYLIFRPTHV